MNNMYFYNLTLERAMGITHAIHGDFSGSDTQEIVIARGKYLELLRIDPNSGKVHTLLTVEVFGIVRSLMAFCITGGTKDHIIVGSDSGKFVILEYVPAKNVLEKVHQDTFGKSGCRRTVPGQYLAIDPKGRAVMVGAVEKQKFVYALSRDAEATLTISPPLEAHKSNTLVYDMVGIDVGFGNPIFACLEIDFEAADTDVTGEVADMTQQTVAFYELDFALNSVVRKYSEPLEEHANFLLPVPGESVGPGGILVCSENYLVYKNPGHQLDIRCPIPRRRNDLDDPERGMIFICLTTYKTASAFFYLAQTEQNDIFKVTLEVDGDVVTEIKLRYFDTIPAATAMCVLNTGFLFAASEFGNHYVYHIASLGDDNDEPEFSSVLPLEEGEAFYFAPRRLRNLILVDELDSLSPILSSHVSHFANENAEEDTTQLYLACGRGPRSSLRVLRHGLEVEELTVYELPGNPNAVWTIKRGVDEEFHAYIVVSFPTTTMVLSVGETIEEVDDSGFVDVTATLSCSALGTDAAVQIYPEGLRYIRFGSARCIQDWKVPSKKEIVECAVNQRQVVIALTGGELLYFEMNAAGVLKEHELRKELDGDVVCMAVGSAPSAEQMARFLAAGLADNTVRIVSLDPSSCLTDLSELALPAAVASLCVVEIGGGEVEGEEAAIARGTFYVYVGLQNGMLLRTVLDPATGDFSDTSTKCLGSRPVKLFRMNVQGSEAVLAMSTRTWLSYTYRNRFHLTPLSCEPLEYASGLSSEQCPEGVVAISANTLRILAFEKLGTNFCQIAFPLEYTPRNFVVHEESSHLIIIETEHNAYTEETKKEKKAQLAEEIRETAGEEEQELGQELADSFLCEDLPESVFCAPKAGRGMWASLIRIMDPSDGKSHQTIRLLQNEAAVSICLAKFFTEGDQQFVIVGVANDLGLCPRQASGGYLLTYRVDDSCTDLEFVHRTEMNEVPNALCSFQGRLLVGAGSFLRLYGMGKDRLLRKCENKHIPNLIVKIMSLGPHIFVADIQEGVFFARYLYETNRLVVYADDTSAKWVTTAIVLDSATVATADKFGNIAVIRLPANIAGYVYDDPFGSKALAERGLLNGSSQKADCIVNFHLGEICTSLQRAVLTPGGSETLLYTTISGTVGVLIPFSSHDDRDFFQQLEAQVRSAKVPLCGRRHHSFRSYYYPLKNAVDGDLCEQFNALDSAKQRSIAEDLERTPGEVSKKLVDLRTSCAF